ncbi:zinc-dependent alcohol dehydrogenase [Cytobacillus purgationiresistens]|uniref:L-iditol 2-dehydrogenase n=1 Tax=Cytobacillus purgationiresistens TaxID=863449 RepID=A0ABU0AIF4_9BACI|nr:alcohol dehydrogenase catalytic domain-containing protein [Cytobacillus purgationiresistens]MDQ0271007.1 L-iditol 2-dehydrogenase [Cytobacillus purgationiresistens]
MKMIQAVMTNPGIINFNEVEVPEVKKHEIKIKVKNIGVCGSDIHVNHGKHPYTSYPVVQGHEISGKVTEVGAEVDHIQVGDKVTIQPQVVCGECYLCKNGMYHVCENLKVMGFQTTGMASEFFVVDANKATILPEGMTWEEGAMVEPLAVAIHAVQRTNTLDNKNILVIGGGPIGNLVAQTAKAMGAKKVVVSELSASRLDIAEKCGLKTINSNEESLTEGIKRHFGDEKADVIFECVGSSYTVAKSIEIARKGSTIVMVGVVSDLTEVNMGFVQDHELTLLGSAMYQSNDFDKAVELIKNKKIELNRLITNRVEFTNYLDAYSIIDNQKDKVMKVMIEMI